MNSASGFRQLTQLPFCSNSQLQFALESARLGVCCGVAAGICGGHSPAPHAPARSKQNPPSALASKRSALSPVWERGLRGRRGRPFVCLRSFVFQTFRVSKLRGRKGLFSLQAFLSSSKASSPSFHILQLTVWDLHRFIPHSRAQSMHAVQPERMRAHPLPFSAGCCRQPSPLSLAVAAAGVPAPRNDTRSAWPRIQSAFADCRPAELGDKNSPVRASERDFSPVSMSTIQSIFAIRLPVAEALSREERCPSPIICAGIPELPGCGVKRQGLLGGKIPTEGRTHGPESGSRCSGQPRARSSPPPFSFPVPLGKADGPVSKKVPQPSSLRLM